MRHAVLALACVTIGTTPAHAQGRIGVDFTPGLVPIVEGVYAYEGPLHLEGEEEIVRTNSLVIVTDEGVVVVDGQDNPDEGRLMIAAIREVTDQPIRFLINASPHGDHINSNEVFEGATIIAHEGAREAISEVRSRNLESGEGFLPTLPHQTYRDKMTLVVGGRTIELYYFGRGHTRGDTVVFLPDVGVAFLSELYFNGVFASVGEGFVEEHIATLLQAMELPAEWWIPGHGFIAGQSRAQLAQGIEDYLANLEVIHAAVSLRVARGETLLGSTPLVGLPHTLQPDVAPLSGRPGPATGGQRGLSGPRTAFVTSTPGGIWTIRGKEVEEISGLTRRHIVHEPCEESHGTLRRRAMACWAEPRTIRALVSPFRTGRRH